MHAALDEVVERLSGVAMCHSHLDYGLPNAFTTGVIDWQHHGLAPWATTSTRCSTSSPSKAAARDTASPRRSGPTT
ncbi:hypothetical protein ACFQX6_65890 [Streptosporangium lutulentum]